jgi:hypothetical protein
VDVHVAGYAALDPAKEAQELLMAMAGHAIMEDLTGGYIESSEKGRGAVAFVIEGLRAGSALLERQAGLSSVESLDLALLVEGKTTARSGKSR